MTTKFTCTRRQFLSLGMRAALGAAAIGLVGNWKVAEGASPSGLQQLRSDLLDQVSAYPGKVALAVTDLQTGASTTINGDRPQTAGCSINLFLLLRVVHDLEEGRYSVNQVDWIIRAGIGASDPRWAKELLLKTGGGSLAAGVTKVHRYMHGKLGLVNSLYDHAPEYWREFSLYDRDNVVTANEANATLARLYRGQLFSPSYTSYALAKLTQISPRLNNVIPALLPSEGVKVAHKIGFIHHSGYSTYNDIGLVMIERGRGRVAYAFSFLSEANSNYWAAPKLGARLSRMVFDYFNSRY